MHKLVFEDDILPDGTEVNYVSHGKVATKICKVIVLAS